MLLHCLAVVHSSFTLYVWYDLSVFKVSLYAICNPIVSSCLNSSLVITRICCRHISPFPHQT